jgi:uncharacterized membrane protein HdeD (DUF308 family)
VAIVSSTREAQLDPLTLWWIAPVLGVATFGVGLFLVIEPHEALTVLTVILGILLLIDGAAALVSSITGRGEGRGLLALLGILSLIAGLVLVRQPFNTLVVLTVILGVWFVVAGAVRFVAAFSMIGSRAPSIIAALVELAAGILILAWPEIGLSTFAVIVGIVMMMRGLLLIYAGWLLHKLSDVEAQDPYRPAMA